MADQNHTQTNTPPPANTTTKAQTLDTTPSTLGANASNSGITIDLPSTVETKVVQAVSGTPIATPTDSLRVPPTASTPSRANTVASTPSLSTEGGSTSMDRSQDAATRARRSAGALMHDARDKAAESYAHLAHSADELGQRAGEAVGRAYAQTRRASSTVGQFASTHALPLMMIGTGMAWLGMNLRNERRVYAPREVDIVARRSMRSQNDLRSRYPEPRRPVYVEGTEGSKLLTVPVHSRGTLGN